MSNHNKILVSVFCPTYNHANYITKCLESIVTQKTNFDYELIVQDDFSTDNNAKIIKSFSEKYDFIKPIFHEENYFQNGKNINEYFFKNSAGKYLSLCEGDDYWTDPNKLQKQVDFLEGSPDFSICGHKTKMLFENDATKEQIEGADEGVYTIEDLTKNNFIPTSSVVFRKEYIKELPDWFLNVAIGDWALFLLMAQHGKIKMFNDVMSVHRIHGGGIWTKNEVNNDWHKQWEILMKTLNILRTKFDEKVNTLLTKTYFDYVFKLANYYLDRNSLEEFQQITTSIAKNPYFNISAAEGFLNNITANTIQKNNEIMHLKDLNNQIKISKSYKIGNALVKMFNIFKQ